MFLPTTRHEMDALNWDCLDVILVTGDSYIDHPSIGVSVIGKVLLDAGFRVGVIAQPDTDSDKDIKRLGEPRLFWGVSGGSIDSLVANYTASGKPRKQDDYTPGGDNCRRPDRAVIAYTNLIRQQFKNTCPIVLGGVEASSRRIAHYDFWSKSIRRSILFDAKANIIVYGMGERAVLELAAALRDGRDWKGIRGICYIAKDKPANSFELHSYREVTDNKAAFIDMFRQFCQNSEGEDAHIICQLQDTRYLVQNPPQTMLSPNELDHVYALDYKRDQHPYYERQGKVRALDTIRFSITTHRGCFGGCSFCSIGLHQGRAIASRSEGSILEEARLLTRHKEFKGVITDVGGPTANMYEFACDKKKDPFACREKACLLPEPCTNLRMAHRLQIDLLRKLRQMPDIKHVFVASGIRHDMVMADKKNGRPYLEELVNHHLSGQMKIAPEHISPQVLWLMNKPGNSCLLAFKNLFYELNNACGKKQFLTYYFIAAHPGCTLENMAELKRFATRELLTNPEQVQIFTPLPSTWSAAMYYTETDPRSGSKIFVEKDPHKRQQQKDTITAKRPIEKWQRAKVKR
jgi:uncharacterized radical SAM protein YgiQ